MKTLGNLIWLVLAGFWLALGYAFAGVVACVLIVTIPFGLASFRLAGYALWPFGRTVVPSESRGAASCLGNVVWFIFAGWWLVVGHLVTAALLAVTIIGFPLAIANVKLIPLAIAPFGKRIVRISQVGVVPAGGFAPPPQLG